MCFLAVLCWQKSRAEFQSATFIGQGPVTVAASAKLGKVIDLAWVPLPAPVGGGSVVAVAGEDGSLAIVDATQTVEARSLKRRLAGFKNLVGGRWPFPQVRRSLSGASTAHDCTLRKVSLAHCMLSALPCHAVRCSDKTSS